MFFQKSVELGITEPDYTPYSEDEVVEPCARAYNCHAYTLMGSKTLWIEDNEALWDPEKAGCWKPDAGGDVCSVAEHSCRQSDGAGKCGQGPVIKRSHRKRPVNPVVARRRAA